MDYLLSFIYKKEDDTLDNNKNVQVINSIDTKYKEEIKVIDEFLKTSKHKNHKPACGGCHNPNDPRVHNLYVSAMSEHVCETFMNDIKENLGKVLMEKSKNKCLTYKLAKKYAIEYIQEK